MGKLYEFFFIIAISSDRSENIRLRYIKTEDLKYTIRDTATGVFYDIRTQNLDTILSQENQKLTRIPNNSQNKPWEEWWKMKHEQNERLLMASKQGNLPALLRLLSKKNHGDLVADINFKGNDGFTALHHAANEGYIELAMNLVRLGANIDAMSIGFRTPMHLACIKGFPEIIMILIQAKGNINAQDKKGNTPIHILAKSGQKQILEICLKYRPDLTLKNIYGETAKDIAISIDIRNLFSSSKEQNSNKKYIRTVISNLLVHNSRVDMVKSILIKGKKLDKIMNRTRLELNKIDKEKILLTKRSRREKIIEVIRKISTLSLEEERRISESTHCSSIGSDRDLEEKVTLDQFEIISQLGRGSFGEVYLVKFKPNSKHYAMKVLSKTLFMKENMLKYAKVERDVLCYTRCPFIVSLDYAFQNSEKLFLILQYCPGYC